MALRKQHRDVLSGLTGVVLGPSVPTALAEVDDVHRDAVAGSFRMALLEVREKAREGREAVKS